MDLEKTKEKPKKVVRINHADVINVLSGSLKPDREKRQRSLILWLDIISCAICPYAYIGKLHAERAIDFFHKKYKDMALEVRVRRYPFSLNGPHRQYEKKTSLPGYGQYSQGKEPRWHDALLSYCKNDHEEREALEDDIKLAGEEVGLHIDFNVQVHWQPVDAHRAIWYAGRFGKQEIYVDALAKRHFELCQSVVHRVTLLRAAKDVDLDFKALDRLLNTEEMIDNVWHNFHDMIYLHQIEHSPVFIINLPDSLSPLRPDQPGFRSSQPLVIDCAANFEAFFQAFEELAHAAIKPRYDMSLDSEDDPFIKEWIEPLNKESHIYHHPRTFWNNCNSNDEDISTEEKDTSKCVHNDDDISIATASTDTTSTKTTCSTRAHTITVSIKEKDNVSENTTIQSKLSTRDIIESDISENKTSTSIKTTNEVPTISTSSAKVLLVEEKKK